MTNIRKLLEFFAIPIHEGPNALLERFIEMNQSISKVSILVDITNAISNSNFNWVQLAIESRFVYSPCEVNSGSFDVDDLLIFTDSFRWRDVVQPDAILTPEERVELKEQFREVGVQHFDNIHELIDHPDFAWLPF